MDIKIDSKTVVSYDLDDTLYNEIEYLKSAYQYLAKQHNPDNWKKLYFEMFSRYRSGENAFAFLSAGYKQPIEEIIDVYRNHKPDLQVMPGVLEVFNKIKKQHGKIAIITDGRSITQRNKIRALGLEPYIDFLVISEETGFQKPGKENFQKVMHAFNAQNYWYVADNVKKDFIAPKSLGWNTIGLIDAGLNIHKEGFRYLSGFHEPDFYVLSHKEINIL